MTIQLESVHVLIIGAGLSGIGAACQLRRNCPDRSFMILESREVSGGTWELFRYPGIRSDSDMYNYSYGFKPWRDKSAIAAGEGPGSGLYRGHNSGALLPDRLRRRFHRQHQPPGIAHRAFAGPVTDALPLRPHCGSLRSKPWFLGKWPAGPFNRLWSYRR